MYLRFSLFVNFWKQTKCLETVCIMDIHIQHLCTIWFKDECSNDFCKELRHARATCQPGGVFEIL